MKKKENYVIAFLFTTLVFFLGIVVGSGIISQKTESLQQELQLDILETQSLELELSMLEQVSDHKTLCGYIEARLPEVIKKKVELGRLFDTGGIPQEEAELLESQFVTSLVKFFLFTRLQEERCNIVKPRILYFFGESEVSREQSRVLDNIVFSLSDENITVFAFNNKSEERQPLIKLMYQLNGVKILPTVVINNTKYEGFQTKDRITEILCRDYQDLPIC